MGRRKTRAVAMVVLQNIAIDGVTLKGVQALCVQSCAVLGIQAILGPVRFEMACVMQCRLMAKLRVEPLSAHSSMITTSVGIHLLTLELVLDTLAVGGVAN